MRFAFPLVAALAAVSSVAGRAVSALSSRDLIDICAQVDVALTVDVLGIAVAVGLLDVCLCVSALPVFIETNAVAIAAVDLVGAAAVIADITALINSATGHQTCTFPDHCESICSSANPCGFQCIDGYDISGKDCVCLPPKIECNGQCVKGPSCPSSNPKRAFEMQKRSAACSDGFTACGVYGWTGLRSNTAWECVDTENDLESCGGCATPLTPSGPRGIDCTAIPGVSDVSCRNGACHVFSCLPGYAASMDGSYCIKKQQKHFENDFSAALKNAANFGLEHVPF